VERLVEQPEIAYQIAAATDPSEVIIERGMDPANPSKLCAETIELFVSILAGEASNLALRVLATGGIYLAGGSTVHMLDAIRRPPFMQAFTRKRRFADMMSRIPIRVVVGQPALIEAAAYGFDVSNGLKVTA
jgi:glucokinase